MKLFVSSKAQDAVLSALGAWDKPYPPGNAELAGATGLSQQHVSRALRSLAEVGLVEFARDGKRRRGAMLVKSEPDEATAPPDSGTIPKPYRGHNNGGLDGDEHQGSDPGGGPEESNNGSGGSDAGGGGGG